MINIEKNIKFKNKINKKVLIFDLDGVLVDSKINMRKAWTAVQKKFNFQEKKFKDYFSKIGQPFNIILSQLSILNNHKQIKKCYDSNSIKNLDIVKFYPKIIKELKLLYSKNFYLCIVTSKDKIRTNLMLGDAKKLFSIIQCPQKNLIGKPYPDQILNVIKKLNVKKKDCVYIGDTNIDYLSAKNAKIDFIFAEWGYGPNHNYKLTIKNITKLKSLLQF